MRCFGGERSMNHRCPTWSGAAIYAIALLFTPMVLVDCVRADDLGEATKIVKAASDEELRTEFQQRFEARNSVRRSSEKVETRAVSPFTAVDDASLLRATRLNARAIYGKDE